MRLVVGISGASGAIYGIRLLSILKEKNIESHLIISDSAKRVIAGETNFSIEEIKEFSAHIYENNDLSAPISSGSFKTDGMIVVPCSIKTLSAITHSYNETLIVRAADVTLKERRKLVLVVRDTPFHAGHLRLMLRATMLGAIVYPPVPAFYLKPRTIEELVDQTIGRILDIFGIDIGITRWPWPHRT